MEMGLWRDDYLLAKPFFVLGSIQFIKYLCEVAWKVFSSDFFSFLPLC